MLRCRASRKGKMSAFLCLLSKEIRQRQSQCHRKYEVTVLSSVIIHESEAFLYVEDNSKNEDSTTTQSVWIEPTTSTATWRVFITTQHHAKLNFLVVSVVFSVLGRLVFGSAVQRQALPQVGDLASMLAASLNNQHAKQPNVSFKYSSSMLQ